jgi:hypothetical protein
MLRIGIQLVFIGSSLDARSPPARDGRDCPLGIPIRVGSAPGSRGSGTRRRPPLSVPPVPAPPVHLAE